MPLPIVATIVAPLALFAGGGPPPDAIGEPPNPPVSTSRPVPLRGNLERGLARWTRWYWSDVSGNRSKVSGLVATCGPAGTREDRRWRCFVTYRVDTTYEDGSSDWLRVLDVHAGCFASRRVKRHALEEGPPASGSPASSTVAAPGRVGLVGCAYLPYMVDGDD